MVHCRINDYLFPASNVEISGVYFALGINGEFLACDLIRPMLNRRVTLSIRYGLEPRCEVRPLIVRVVESYINPLWVQRVEFRLLASERGAEELRDETVRYVRSMKEIEKW